MRFDDALCAINTLNGGALIGGGITLLKISDKLKENNEVDKIIKQTLTKPFEILIESVGLNSKTIENKIREENYNTIYNVKSNNFENSGRNKDNRLIQCSYRNNKKCKFNSKYAFKHIEYNNKRKQLLQNKQQFYWWNIK